MIFSLLVLGSPISSQSSYTALRFSQAALKANHQLYRIFFFDDGATTGNCLITLPQDEINLPEQWQLLANDHELDMVVCVSSALKRGVLDAKEAMRYEKSAANMLDGFEISGLGQLVDAALHSDRIITFGC